MHSQDDVEPVAHETRDRIITGLVTIVPVLALGLVAWQLWAVALGWNDIVVFLVMYALTGIGITVGFHRFFTHRSFKTRRPIRIALAAFGSMAIEGPIVSWVADHRKHHAFSDRLGDPHSPHVEHGHGWKGALKGLAHAHVGWLFIHTQRGRKTRYAPDLMRDRDIAWIDRTFIWWAIGGFVVSFALGFLFGGADSLKDGLTGMLWGGLVRVLVLHHATYSINSLCHFFGRRPFETGDESRNLAWLAPFSLGEAWHNGHHASRPPPATGSNAGSSTSPRGSSPRSSAPASRGTSCGSTPRRSPPSARRPERVSAPRLSLRSAVAARA